VDIKVYFPSEKPGPLPGVVFIQGGFVSTASYEWQAIALAQAGYVVAMPENSLELAFFTMERGATARELLASPPVGSALDGLVDPARIAVAGHSLGSVVAAKLALREPFAALVLEAGFPEDADQKKFGEFNRPSLSLAGSLDCSAKLENVQAGWQSLPSPSALVVLDGVTHYQFTESDEPDRKKNCIPTRPLDEAHDAITTALTRFLDAALSDGSLGSLNSVPGATVETR
jgi:pimeloyl-ACP methyl ester carboxylesterase